ncbi:MAG: acyl-ACP--UDP-N-acetylglucosamine O-acyltransferase [Planctomycetota bacterium]|jgi:UDP-N-acetylglucosamine acyltransferase
MTATRIHPTAVIDECAELGEDVQIGAFVVIEGPVRIGARTQIAPYVHVLGRTAIGPDNVVYSGAVLGGLPQDKGFDPASDTGVVIGAGNTIREHVTVHRATRDGESTRIGDGNYLMVGSHVGHDTRIGDNVTMANAALLAGHVTLEDFVVIAGGVVVHQHARVGRYAMLGGLSGVSMDVPPYMLAAGRNRVSALNSVGLRRAAAITPAARKEIKEAFRILYREGRMIGEALEEIGRRGFGPEVEHLLEFCRAAKKGICPFGSPRQATDR